MNNHQSPTTEAPAAATKTRCSYRANLISDILLNAPTLIHEWQSEYNLADRELQKRVAAASLTALTAALFIDKRTGQPCAASNEKERDIAINYILTQDAEIARLAADRDALYTNLQLAKQRYEGARAAAKLLAVRGA